MKFSKKKSGSFHSSRPWLHQRSIVKLNSGEGSSVERFARYERVSSIESHAMKEGLPDVANSSGERITRHKLFTEMGASYRPNFIRQTRCPHSWRNGFV